MNKRIVLFAIITILVSIMMMGQECYAADLDRIDNYVITVDPRMNDGTLDITYEITWTVLDSTTEGPLEWVQIGTANSNFDNPTALTSNIKKIKKYNGSYVRIDFKKKHYAGESITFKYKLHQSDMYMLFADTCIYSFIPAWFTDAKVDKMTIKWNTDGVKSSNSTSTEDNYLVWTKTNMGKGEKLAVTVEYDKTAFSSLAEYGQSNSDNSASTMVTIMIIIFIVFFIIIIVAVVAGGGGTGGGYYRHSGFYGGYGYGSHRHHRPHHHHRPRSGGGCVRSSCACARSSCACACAGSGRAGCSKKDFYGTKLTRKKIEKAMGNKSL